MGGVDITLLLERERILDYCPRNPETPRLRDGPYWVIDKMLNSRAPWWVILATV
jgi:hypothetical protein